MNKKILFLSVFVFCLCFFTNSVKPSYAENMYLYDVDYDSISKSIVLKTSKGVKAQTIKVDNPPRTVINLESTIFDPVSKKIDVNDGFIKQIRIGQFQSSPPISRISIDMTKHINFDIKTKELRDRQNIVLKALDFENTNININNSSIKNYKENKTKVIQNDLETLKYDGNKITISARSKISYELKKEDGDFYSFRIFDFTMSGIDSIPVKDNQDIQNVKVREKDNDTYFTFKMKSGMNLVAKPSKYNKIEIYSTKLPDVVVPDNIINTRNNNYVSIDFTEIGTNSNIYLSSSNQSLKYKMFQLSNPERLVIDTFGTSIKDFVDPFINKFSKNIQRARIGYIEKTTTEPEGIRIVFETKGKVSVTESLQNNKTLQLLFKGAEDSIYQEDSQPKFVKSNKKYVIVLDPGHGGKDPGAIGKAGFREKDVTLNVTYYLRQMLLDSGVSVLMARSDDSEVLLQPRVDVGNNNSADLFVSVHCNSMDGTGARGIETYYRTPQSANFAQIIHRNMVDTVKALDRGVRVRNFFVIRKTIMPSVLVEIGYLSNPTEEYELGSPIHQKKVATALYKGIREYLGYQNKI